MTSSSNMPPVIYLALALLGHAVLIATLVSRLHGLAINRHVVDAVTLLLAAAGIGLPVVIVQAAYPASLSSLSVVSRELATGYAGGCCVVVFAAALHRLWLGVTDRWLLRGVVWSRSETRIDDSRLAVAAVRPLVPRLLARLPWNQLLRPRLVRLELRLPSLPREYDGVCIAHLSDLHMSGRLEPPYYAAILDQVLANRPDAIALTGDIVERDACLPWIDRLLNQLPATAPSFFVLGNHDRKTKPDEVVSRLVAGGWQHMGGRVVRVTIAGRQWTVVGDERPWFGRDLATDWPQLDTSEPRLSLVHTPDRLAWASRSGIDLLLAGHNHGGQICLPWLGALVAPSVHGTRYAGGLFRRGTTVLHVSPGTASLAPLRYNCPAELTLITLRSTVTSLPDQMAASFRPRQSALS